MDRLGFTFHHHLFLHFTQMDGNVWLDGLWFCSSLTPSSLTTLCLPAYLNGTCHTTSINPNNGEWRRQAGAETLSLSSLSHFLFLSLHLLSSVCPVPILMPIYMHTCSLCSPLPTYNIIIIIIISYKMEMAGLAWLACFGEIVVGGGDACTPASLPTTCNTLHCTHFTTSHLIQPGIIAIA